MVLSSTFPSMLLHWQLSELTILEILADYAKDWLLYLLLRPAGDGAMSDLLARVDN